MTQDRGATSWIKYQSYLGRPPKPHKGGSNYLVNQECSEGLVVKVAFGFQRQTQDWGEAGWTAADLR